MPQNAPIIVCCVPFCGRRHRNVEGYGEWCCGPHFGLTDAMARKVYKRMLKRERPGFDGVQSRDRIWRRIKRQAVERAAGI